MLSQTFATNVEATVGEWTEANHLELVRKNTWPSDHFAVITRYGLGTGH